MKSTHQVLVVSEFGSLNGGENSFLTAASGLDPRRWNFLVLAPAESDLAREAQRRNFQWVPFSFFDDAGKRLPLEELRLQLANLIDSIRPDLVHANSLSTSRVVGPVTRKLGVPSLGYLRDIIKLNKRVLSDINDLDWVVAVSHATRNYHLQQGLTNTRSTVIYNGIEFDQFHAAAKRPAQPPFRMMFVGQIGLRKGIDTLLEAVAEIDSPRWVLDIIGERHSQKAEAIEHELQLREMAEKLNRSPPNEVRFLGRQQNVAERMREAHLLVHPAKQEPLGRVLLEAFASGLPVVSTHVGGTPEIFEGLESGRWLAPPGDSQRLASCIREFVQLSNHQKSQLSDAVRKIALSKFAVEQTSRNLEQLYDRLLG